MQTDKDCSCCKAVEASKESRWVPSKMECKTMLPPESWNNKGLDEISYPEAWNLGMEGVHEMDSSMSGGFSHGHFTILGFRGHVALDGTPRRGLSMSEGCPWCMSW